MEGYRLIERAAPRLFGQSLNADVMLQSDASNLAAMAAVVATINPSAVETARKKMFTHIRFTSKNVPEWTVLAGNEETAFAELDALPRV